MFGLLSSIVGPVGNLASSWMENKTESQRGKTAIAKAKAEAEAKVMVSAATSTAEWEKIMAKGSQDIMEGRMANNSI